MTTGRPGKDVPVDPGRACREKPSPSGEDNGWQNRKHGVDGASRRGPTGLLQQPDGVARHQPEGLGGKPTGAVRSAPRTRLREVKRRRQRTARVPDPYGMVWSRRFIPLAKHRAGLRILVGITRRLASEFGTRNERQSGGSEFGAVVECQPSPERCRPFLVSEFGVRPRTSAEGRRLPTRNDHELRRPVLEERPVVGHDDAVVHGGRLVILDRAAAVELHYTASVLA